MNIISFMVIGIVWLNNRLWSPRYDWYCHGNLLWLCHYKCWWILSIKFDNAIWNFKCLMYGICAKLVNLSMSIFQWFFSLVRRERVSNFYCLKTTPFLLLLSAGTLVFCYVIRSYEYIMFVVSTSADYVYPHIPTTLIYW